MARLGVAWLGTAWRGKAGQAWLGTARPGWARQGRAGEAGQGRGFLNSVHGHDPNPHGRGRSDLSANRHQS